MSNSSLNKFINRLILENELCVINEKVSPILEISEITDRISKARGKALLFRSTGTDFPLLINAYGSEKRILKALNINSFEELESDIESYFELISKPPKGLKSLSKALKKLFVLTKIFPKRLNIKGSCYSNTLKEVDLYKLPILKCWPFDGAQFITLPMVHTIDLDTSVVNVGMYRMQIFDKQTCGMHWHKHKGGALHYEKYKERRLKMPVVVTLGGNPVYTYCSTAPLPEMVSEYALASYLAKRKLKMVKASNANIYIPEDVDLVIEGYIDPTENLELEGPFGDHTGYYSLPDYYPKMHITRISYCNNAVYPATIVGIPPMEDEFLGLATEKIFLPLIKKLVIPELIDMYLPAEGGFHNLAIVSIKHRYPGQAIKTMNAMWGAGQLMFVKNIIVVSEEVNIRDYEQVLTAIFKNSSFPENFHFMFGPLDVLDHANSKPMLGKKMGINACNNDENSFISQKTQFNKEKFLEHIRTIPIIKNVDLSFVERGFSIAIIYVDKFQNDLEHNYETFVQHFSEFGVRFYVLIDYSADDLSYADILWLFLANFDPEKDIYIKVTENQNVVLFDGTQKVTNKDKIKYKRPNATIMDENTIKLVDEKWFKYNIGEFIESPSLKYKKITLKEGYLYEE